VANTEEGTGNGRSVCPECAGQHAGYNGQDKGFLLRKETVISET
jgi:hypothetical protein